MFRDRQQRSTLERVDDDDRRFQVANARRLIYEKNYAVDSKTLAPFLQSKTLVPTSVSSLYLQWLAYPNITSERLL
jgi:hypothetical protein